jgi:Xaa-Pro dipeptidase
MSKLPFSNKEYERRITGVKKALEEKDLDALISSIHWNVQYLTGLGVSSSHYKVVVIPREGELIGVIRELELPGAKASSLVANWVTWKDEGDPTYMSENPVKATHEALEELNLRGKRIGVETGYARFINHMTIRHFEYLKKMMPETKFVDDENIVIKLRIIKSDAEIECMRKAAIITERTALEAIQNIRPGVSEAEVYAKATQRAWSHNECNGLSLMLQAGHAGTLIHVSSRGQINLIGPGDVVFMELGATVDSYFNTRVRTISVGEPSPTVKRVSSAVIKGLNSAIEFIKPGVTSGEVDNACRSVIAKAGYGEFVKHRLGYSLGLGWNEGEVLCLRAGDKAKMKKGMVFHMVPGIWNPELGFGISYSENVLVTEDGSEVIDAGMLERKLYVK